MWGWLSVSLVVFFIVMMCLLWGMKVVRVFSSEVFLEFVLLEIMML